MAASGEGRRVAGRDAGLDGVRALAALSVLLFHTWLYRVGPPRGQLTRPLDQVLVSANVGLICFFVLSGFLLYRSFARASLGGGRPVDVGAYAVRRIARIVPAYYACLFGCLALYAAFGPRHIVPAAPHIGLFLVFGENYSNATLMQIDPVMWTLCVEAAFYLLLPVIGIAALRLGPGRPTAQVTVITGLIGVTIVWNTLGHVHGWGPLLYKALPAYLGHFAIGMLVAVWAERRRGRVLSARVSAALVLVGFAAVVAEGYWNRTAGGSGWPIRHVSGHLPAAAGFALIVAAVVAGRGPAVRWLSWRPLAALGVISYGIYLWHLPLLMVLRNAGLAPVALVPRLAVVGSVSVLVAWLSWRLLERPLIDRAAERVRDRVRARVRPAPAG
ncbi:MAG: acyltransferase, partial [Solirubrobacterales bacterium]|nr:acyltransferase [Solirubrobacterales bacterium]